MTLPARRVDDIDADRAPGVFEIRELDGTAGIAFMCPCGCGREGYLPVGSEDEPRWSWDGNRDAPTLSPSVLFRGGCKWHGWLKAGVWTSC